MNGRLLRFSEVKTLVGLSRSTIWRMERAGTFPKHLELGKNSIAWDENEIREWKAKLAAARDARQVKSDEQEGSG